MAEDRLPLLQDHGTLVGIDFIRVDVSTQQTLWVFFLGSDTAVTSAYDGRRLHRRGRHHHREYVARQQRADGRGHGTPFVGAGVWSPRSAR